MSRRRLIVTAACATALAVPGLAWAAGLTVSAAGLATINGPSSRPPTTCTLTSSADSHVRSGNGTTNYGTQQTMFAQSSLLGGNRRSFLRFDVASCGIPSVAALVSSTLQMYIDQSGGAATLEVVRTTGTWTETGVTWNNQPAVSGTVTATIASANNTAGLKTVSVQSDIQAWITGTANNGWAVRDDSESLLLGTRAAEISARENTTAANRPQLTIVYYP